MSKDEFNVYHDNDHGCHGHGCHDCVPVEVFRMISQPYEGIPNDGTETVINNRERTIEVKLKPQQYGSKYAFPNRGNPSIIYIDIHENAAYRWDEESGSYVCIGADFNQIKIINGGTANGN